MGRFIRFISDLYSDGYKLIGLVAPLLSIFVSVYKLAGPEVDWLKDVPWAWVPIPIILWLLLAYWRRWREYNEHVEAPRHDARSLPQMPITDIAEYLLNDSAWGWRR